jgi:hypothetical protein
MQDEHQEVVIELRALRSSATWVWELVLKESDEASSLLVSLSSAADLIEGRVDAVAANEVRWGARLALTAALMHFPKLDPELELLGCPLDANTLGLTISDVEHSSVGCSKLS